MTEQKRTPPAATLAATGTERLTNLGNLSHYSTSVLSLSSQDPADLVDTAPERTHCYRCDSKRFWRRPVDDEPLCVVCTPPPPSLIEITSITPELATASDVATKDEPEDEPTFWDNYDDDTVSADLRREERLAMCGKSWLRTANPENPAERLFFTFHCDLWRDGYCPKCLQYRAEKFESRLDDALGAGDVYTVKLDRGDGDKLARRLKRSEFLRLPTTDGDVFFASADIGRLVDDELEQELDWLKLAATPEGRNASGDLGKPAAKPDDRVAVKALILDPSTDDDQEDAAWAAAIEATPNLQPTTVEEAVEAVEKRIDAFADALRDQGKPALGERMVKVECRISRIGKNSIRKIRHDGVQFDDLDDITVPF